MAQRQTQQVHIPVRLVTFVALIGLVMLGCDASTATSDEATASPEPATAETTSQETASQETAAPTTADFRLPDLDGNSVGPPDFAGKVVVAEFWATWCAPCRVQAKMLDKLFHEVDPDDVQFLAINVGESAAKISPYLEKTPFPYPVLLDEGDQLMERYRLIGLPTILVVDRAGEITYSHVGLVDSGTLRLELIKAGMTVK